MTKFDLGYMRNICVRAALSGDGIILQDLKVENTAGAEKQQAVALRVSATAP